jgi:hypothetical protein
MSAFRGKAEQRGHREIVALDPERKSSRGLVRASVLLGVRRKVW